MEIAVKDAAARLGVGESRVRQLLVAGDLSGRRLGRAWLVDEEDVARLQGHRRRPGRPVGPRRAWAIIDMLDGGSAPWLSYSERSQVRSYLARLGEPDADAWRGILRGRSEVRLVRAHSAAVARLSGQVGVLRAGPGEAVQRGFDLLVLGEPRQEFYVPAGEWGYLASSLGLQPSADGNVVIRHPLMLWPFGDIAALPDAAIAADLLDGPEPRAVRAGQERLNELLRVVAR